MIHRRTLRPALAAFAMAVLAACATTDTTDPYAAAVDESIASSQDPEARATSIFLRGRLLELDGKLVEAAAAYGQRLILIHGR